MASDREYHVIVDGAQRGPLPRDEVARLAHEGRIDDTTLGWTDGMTVWRPLSQVPGLHNLLAEAPPPAERPQQELLPPSVDSALDRVTRSQAYVIGAGIFFALITIVSIGNIFRFRELGLLAFWGSGALAYVAFHGWRQEEDGRIADAAEWTRRGAIGAVVLALVSFVFGNVFFGLLQLGAGGLFWLARSELLKQQPAAAADDGQQTTELEPAAAGSTDAASAASDDRDGDEAEPDSDPDEGLMSDV